MRNTRFKEFVGSYRDHDGQIRRMREIIRKELTPLQRQAIQEYYFNDKSITRIAAERSVNKSTVCRTMKRAQRKIARFLQYGQ